VARRDFHTCRAHKYYVPPYGILFGRRGDWSLCPLYLGYDKEDNCGSGSVVGIATAYGLDGPGIESRWGVRFSAPVQTGPEAPLYNGYRVFPGGKVRPGRDPSPLSRAEVKNRVELYLYSP
jgi:hypothetical protein